MSFYSIARGKEVGIFSNWDECKPHITGFKGAVYKKFNTKETAEQFLIENKQPTMCETDKIPTKTSIIDIHDDDFTPDYYVYTDGACSKNGSSQANAGLGIFFRDNDPRNTSKRVQGKQTNNTAELGAIIETYNLIKDDILYGKEISIVSDSNYAIRCVTSYGQKCEKKEWKDDIPNREMVKTAYELYKNIPNVRFLHIMAHTTNTDIHSYGNENADRLANEAIGHMECPYSSKPKKVFLQVPYERKDEAKQFGCKWDFKKKMWYFDDNNPNNLQILSLFSTI
jgi:ribonuclease HI